MAQNQVTFIGAGNMARSLVSGLSANGSQVSITVADPLESQLALFDALPVVTCQDNQQAIKDADVVVLAVKPQIADRVFADLTLAPHQLLISIAAGIGHSALTTWTSASQPIVRCMPNTPALLGAGMSALHANDHCTAAHRDIAENILNAAGKTLWVNEESAIDTVTAVSGSGPAYFFLLMEAMVDAGVNLGLDQDTATQLTLQTALGAALMATETADSPAVLRRNVTSPGGTTEAALAIMTGQGLPEIVDAALKQAAHRSVELAAEFSPSHLAD